MRIPSWVSKRETRRVLLRWVSSHPSSDSLSAKHSGETTMNKRENDAHPCAADHRGCSRNLCGRATRMRGEMGLRFQTELTEEKMLFEQRVKETPGGCSESLGNWSILKGWTARVKLKLRGWMRFRAGPPHVKPGIQFQIHRNQTMHT